MNLPFQKLNHLKIKYTSAQLEKMIVLKKKGPSDSMAFRKQRFLSRGRKFISTPLMNCFLLFPLNINCPSEKAMNLINARVLNKHKFPNGSGFIDGSHI